MPQRENDESMSKLVTLSLRLIERLEEMGLLPEPVKGDAQGVEENLEASVDEFCCATEHFLANDVGDLNVPENAEKVGEKLSLLVEKARSLDADVESLEKVVQQAMHLVMKHYTGE